MCGPTLSEPTPLYRRGSWCSRGFRAGLLIHHLLISWPVSPRWQSSVCSLEQDTRLLHAQVGFQGRGLCSLFFQTHVFFYSCLWLVTILVSSSLFSWQGRLLWFQNQTTVGISTCGQFPGLCQQMGENGNPSSQ